MYDRTTVLLLTCVFNCTAGTLAPRLCPVVQWSVHWALSRTTRVLILAGVTRCALETCGKKNASSAFRLNLYVTFTTVEICLMAIYLSYTISEASATSYAKFQRFVVLHWWITGGSDCHLANCLVFLQASKDR